MYRDRSPDGLDFILSSDVKYDTWSKVKQFYEVSFGQVDLVSINLQAANLRERLCFIT